MNAQLVTQDKPGAEEAAPGPNPACPTPGSKEGLRAQAERLQKLVARAEQLPDPAARGVALECIQSLLALYGEGLARILEIVQQAQTQGADLLQQLIQDPTICGLLLIHGLHPLDLSTRLRQALEKVRPFMESHGGNVELLGLEDGFARLRLQGACQSCPSSSVTLELAVRSALEEACPDLAGFEVE